VLLLAVQVQKADVGTIVITLQVDHAEVDMGTEVQCLNAFIKGDVPLQIVRMTGPDLCIGALAAMAAYPYILLRAAELRQARLASTPVLSKVLHAGIHGVN